MFRQPVECNSLRVKFAPNFPVCTSMTDWKYISPDALNRKVHFCPFRNAKRHAGRPTRCRCPMRHISRKRLGNCGLASTQLASHWRKYSSIGTAVRPGQRLSAPSASTQFGACSYSAGTFREAACAKELSAGTSISLRCFPNQVARSAVSPCAAASLLSRRLIFCWYFAIPSPDWLAAINRLEGNGNSGSSRVQATIGSAVDDALDRGASS